MTMYLHELQERKQAGTPNTEWPTMSTHGRHVDQVKRYIQSRGLSWELAEENGWYPSIEANDDWLRVVIPAQVKATGHVYWQARAIHPDAKIRYQSPKGPRLDAIIQVNPFERTELVSVITEGPMDALAVAELGYQAYAVLGITPSSSTVDFVVNKLQRRPTLVVFDNEAFARTQAIHLCVELASRGIRSRPCSVETAKDLAIMPKHERRDFLSAMTSNLRGKDDRRNTQNASHVKNT